jgi:hypothetical protein
MPKLQIESFAELSKHRLEVLAASRKTRDRLQGLLTSAQGIDFMHELKFRLMALSPFDSTKSYNLIEAINQSFTALVSLAGAEWILQHHPESLPLKLNIGPVAGYDIQNADSSIIAECFAAVSPRNNKKLAKDFARLKEAEARHKYLFFYSPMEFSVPYQSDAITVVQFTLAHLYSSNINKPTRAGLPTLGL